MIWWQETWRVVKGELTVVLNDTVITLQAGEDILSLKGIFMPWPI